MSDVDPFVPLDLASADGARARVLPYGAQVVSWTPAPGAPGAPGEEAERLYLSVCSAYRAGAAVRGGVPVVFPQFADQGPLPKHGFARTRPWAVGRAGTDPEGAAFAELVLGDDAETRARWPHRFRATLTVRAAAGWLAVALAVENLGDAPFAFTGALHSYLLVGDVEAARVRGLEGARYRDKTRGGAEQPAAQAPLTPAGEVDRVYAGEGAPVEVDDPTLGRRLRLSQSGFPDVVVWTPGEVAGSALGDVAPGDWRRFLCVEAAAAAAPVTVAAGERWAGGQRLEAA